MARSIRYNKNLQRVQDMLDDNHQAKIQVGTHIEKNVHANKKIGDKWKDSDGVEWEQKDGYRSKISKIKIGIFPHQCKDCNGGLTKSFDIDTHKRYSRCYKCQTTWEQDLQFLRKNRIGTSGNKWQFWVRLQELQRWVSGRKELNQWVDEREKEKNEKVYDMSVANAMSNANVEMSINKNKS
jgi:predicted Zn-ribbon and HTH transcriptional regulator|tara:strand:+ start:725 stop:1270 length:546 start_codon:yes stop_codon:yes gene_type:complete